MSRVIKTLRSNEPSSLLKMTLYGEPRFPGLAKVLIIQSRKPDNNLYKIDFTYKRSQ